MKQFILVGLGILLIIGLSACNGLTRNLIGYTMEPRQGSGPMRGMGMGSGMMARHHATIPQEYARLTNPVPSSEESLARGAEIYGTNCATCHGDGGMGDGPAAASLNPYPAPIAHTSLMLGNSYLFWRISEGGTGEPFNSTMPPWKSILDEQARWDVINYVRALGSGRVSPKEVAGGAIFDPAAENAIRNEILAQAVEQQVLTQDEADLFNQVHSAMDNLAVAGTFVGNGEEALLVELVETGKITQTQADAFNNIHNKLIEANLMQ